MRSEWWNRFIASDPAMRRLRTAIRVTTSVALTLGVMFPLLLLLGQPLPNALIGAVVAIQSSVAVNDDTDRQRRITTLLMPVPATVSLVIATVTEPFAVLRILVFLVVIFVATYVRRFGPRCFALGFVAFFGYFFAMLLRPEPGQLPSMALAAVCGTLAAFVLRFLLLRDDPQGILARGRATLRAQVRGLLRAMGTLAEHPDSPRRRHTLRSHAIRLNETALMLESTVEQLTSIDESGREALRRRVLDIELAAENLLATLVRTLQEPDTSQTVPRALSSILEVVRSDPSRARAVSRNVAEEVEHSGAPDTAMTVRRLGAGLADLTESTYALGRQPKAGTEAARSGANDDERSGDHAEQEQPEATQDTGLSRPETRAAIQVTLATGLAIAGGHLVSPNRWYWAVITAFVVFISANSRGELLVRAWQRTAGTMLGVLAGILVASRVSGHPITELVLVLLCVFAAFYFLGYSYAAMTFFITTMLGIVYGLLGIFGIFVLEIRLVETAIGAAAGIVAAFLVLPTRTHTVVRSRSEEFFTGLRELLDRAGTDIRESDTATGLLESARDLDDRAGRLRARARPLTGYRLRSQRTGLDRWLAMIDGCAYYVRNLAVDLAPATEMVDADTRDRLAGLLSEVAEAAGALAAAEAAGLRRAVDAARERSDSLHDIAESLPAGPTSLHHVLNLLDRVLRTLADLGGELGLLDEPATGAPS